MKNLQKTAFTAYPELFTFLDRFCPMCGSPISMKRVGKLEACDLKCPYYKLLTKGEEERRKRTIEC